MRIEATRIVADWLRDLTTGINAWLPSVPRDGGDPAPPQIAAWADPNDAGSGLAVFDDTRHAWVSLNGDPPATPCLIVKVTGSVDVTGSPWPNGEYRTTTAPIQVAVTYVVANADSPGAVRDGDYTLRAVARCVRELMKDANDASRTRNSVKLIAQVNPLQYFALADVVGSARWAGGLVLNFEAEDGDPSWSA